MADRSTNLSLPFILPNQAQKHVTHNEALIDLDVLAQIVLQGLNQQTPPDSPEEGHIYALGDTPEGDWENRSGHLAAYQSGIWRYHQPKEGWQAWDAENQRGVVYKDSQWQQVGSGASAEFNTEGLAQLGINASPDETNRLALSSEASLFNHNGQGHQLKINKAAPAETASLLFQTEFSGRAEIATAGEDALTVKTTPDGSNWTTALRAEAATGFVQFPAGAALPISTENLIINPEFSINQRGFSGGALEDGAYGHDRWKANGQGVSYQTNGAQVTLQAGTLRQIIEIDLPVPTSLSLHFAQLSPGLSPRLGGLSASKVSPDGLLYIFENITSADGQLSFTVSGSGQFSQPALYAGYGHARWSPRPVAQELALCGRYYTKSFAADIAPASVDDNRWQQAAFSWHPNVATGARVFFPTEMRTRPAITFYSSTGGSDGDWYVLISGQFHQSEARASRIDERGFMPGIFNSGLSLNIGSGYFIGGHWTADAEL